MIRGHKILFRCILLLAAAGGLWWLQHTRGLAPGEMTSEQLAFPVVEEIPAPPLAQKYENTTYKFSVSMPTGFKAAETENDAGGRTIVLQDASGQGIQIYVTPYPDDTHVLTADDVRASIPDMRVADAQEVPIGNEYKGVAFRSDNESFSSDSREVWFIFRSNLYQISTYSRFDPLLKAMFSTWQFK